MKRSLIIGFAALGLILAVSSANANPINKFNFGEAPSNGVVSTATPNGGIANVTTGLYNAQLSATNVSAQSNISIGD